MQNLKHLGKQEIDYVIEEARKELAKGTYDDFFEYVNGYKYQVFDHIQLICDKVQKIADGEQHFYIVEMPPRHGKSMAISKTFPAYYLMKNPDKELIAVTYGDDLAVDIGRANRDKFREYAPKLFGLELSYENASNTAWGISGHTGRMVASGVGGSLTGKGADCLIGSTKVKTTIGDIAIEKLVEMENKPLVLSYNHKFDKLEYKKIVATRKVLNDKLIKITTANGNEVVSTREHRIYEEGKGYKPAALLKCGIGVKLIVTLSHEVPQDYEFCKQDSIIGIEEISGEKQYVYDIQVEGTHNFFANGILVHNCLIVDDPIKNRADAESTLKRERLWDEWESTISTRLQGKASVIIIMTRWHDDDLVGRLLKNSAYPWERLRLPLLSEGEDDLLGRPKGTALCRELGYTEEWAVTKKIDVGTRTWNSLYQQRPTTDGGSIFKEEHFKYFVFNEEQKERYGLGDDVEVLPDMRFMDIVAQSWDCTFKDTKTSDFVAGQVWAKRGAKNYLIDSVRERMGFVDTKNAIIKMSAKHPKATAKYIEDKANGTAIIEILKDEISGIKPITPTESKVSRANAVSAMFEAGNVYFPHPKVFDWVEDITSELKSFPLGAHDDTVDACTQALNELKSKGSSLLDRFRNMV